uniref:GRANULINS domain-containing protein n=1 Tax=Steinernema glaseri TaxID=37863 RepID=A0A1I7Y8X4_9BILA
MKAFSIVLLLAIVASGAAGHCGVWETMCAKGCCPYVNAVCCPDKVLGMCCRPGQRCQYTRNFWYCVQDDEGRIHPAINLVSTSGRNSTDSDVFLS